MLPALVPFLAAAAVVWGPGVVLARAAGVPLRWALALGPALSAAVLGGWALLGGPVTWTGAISAVLACLLLALAPGALHHARRGPALRRRDLGPRDPSPGGALGPRAAPRPGDPGAAARHRRQGATIAVAGVVAGGGGLAALLVRSGATTTGVNQLWDAAWHANLTRLIAGSGDGRPSVAGTLIGAGWRRVDSWYPTGLHVAAALVDRTGGSPSGVVPVAAALGSVVALHVLVVLPAVVAALVWELAGDLPAGGGGGLDDRARGAGAAVAAVLATLPTVFPLDRLWRPAWPMSVGFVLALATVLAAVRCARAVREGAMTAPAAGCVVGGCLLGTGLTHPSGAVVALVVGTGWVAGRAAGLRGRARWRALGAVAAGVGLAAGATAYARDHLPSVASVFAYDYRVGDLGAGLVSVVGLWAPVVPGSGYGVPQDGGQPLVGVLLLAGALGCAALRGARWLAALWAVVVLAALETFVHLAAPLALVSGWFFNVESRLLAVVALVGALAAGLAAAGGAAAVLAWCSSAPGALPAPRGGPAADGPVPVVVPVASATAASGVVLVLAGGGAGDRAATIVLAGPAPSVREPVLVPGGGEGAASLVLAPGAALGVGPRAGPRAGPDVEVGRGGPASWPGVADAPAPRSTGRVRSLDRPRSVGGIRPVRPARRPLPARRAVCAALVLAVVASLVCVGVSSVQRAVPRAGAAYADRVVGPDARAVMSALAAAPLPPGGRVLNDPLDGSPWLYALTGRVPMFTHYDARHPRGDARTLLLGLDDADHDPEVRAALERMRVCYVYASDALVSTSKRRPAGFEDLDGVAALQPIARSGGAVAYRVVPPPAGCEGGPVR